MSLQSINIQYNCGLFIGASSFYISTHNPGKSHARVVFYQFPNRSTYGEYADIIGHIGKWVVVPTYDKYSFIHSFVLFHFRAPPIINNARPKPATTIRPTWRRYAATTNATNAASRPTYDCRDSRPATQTTKFLGARHFCDIVL